MQTTTLDGIQLRLHTQSENRCINMRAIMMTGICRSPEARVQAAAVTQLHHGAADQKTQHRHPAHVRLPDASNLPAQAKLSRATILHRMSLHRPCQKWHVQLFPGMDSIMFGINMIGDAISAAIAPPSAEAASSRSSAASAGPQQPAHPPPVAIWRAQLARWRAEAASAPVQREPDVEQQLCSMESNPWPLLDDMGSSSSACPAAAVHAHADGAAAAAAVPVKAEVKAKTEAEMEVKEEARMESGSSACPAAPNSPLVVPPPPYSPLVVPVKAEVKAEVEHAGQAPEDKKRKKLKRAAQNTAWAKQAVARIEAAKIAKKEQEEEEHWDTWCTADLAPDAAPSTPPDGSETLMAAIALEDTAVAAAAAAAAAQREKEEAAAQREAEYATAERAAVAIEAARAQGIAAAKALKEAVDKDDLLGLFLSSDTDAETDEEQALHTAEHRAELDGIRLPT